MKPSKTTSIVIFLCVLTAMIPIVYCAVFQPLFLLSAILGGIVIVGIWLVIYDCVS